MEEPTCREIKRALRTMAVKGRILYDGGYLYAHHGYCLKLCKGWRKPYLDISKKGQREGNNDLIIRDDGKGMDRRPFNWPRTVLFH
jgi:hypothetical protein